MTPEGIALLVASFLGSTGIASFISSGAKFTRAARLRGAISASKKSLEGLDPSSSAYRATQVSITVMTLEAASYALVRVPMRMRGVLILLALMLGMVIAIIISMMPVMGSLTAGGYVYPTSIWSETAFDWYFILMVIVLSIVYIIILSTTLSLQTSRRRERFVADALRRGTVDYELLVKHGSQLRISEKDLNDVAADITTPDFSQIQHFPEPEPEPKKMPQSEIFRRPWWKFWVPVRVEGSETLKK